MTLTANGTCSSHVILITIKGRKAIRYIITPVSAATVVLEKNVLIRQLKQMV